MSTLEELEIRLDMLRDQWMRVAVNYGPCAKSDAHLDKLSNWIEATLRQIETASQPELLNNQGNRK